MKRLFRILPVAESDPPAFCIALDLRLGGEEVFCPVSGVFRSEGAMSAEIERLQGSLEGLRKEGRRLFEAPSAAQDGIAPGMTPADLWSALAGLEPESALVERFNRLPEEERRAVAEHVFSHCNVFSGRGAFFSSRYDTATGKL